MSKPISGINKKNITNLSSAEFVQGAVKRSKQSTIILSAGTVAAEQTNHTSRKSTKIDILAWTGNNTHKK